ncbi:hypothetical protein [Paracidovorax wautersii]|uniref:hypothetical protein n=1 Tax=Paracidovorax wautersii TaxID=1177982 RepID=UPI0031CF8DFB
MRSDRPSLAPFPFGPAFVPALLLGAAVLAAGCTAPLAPAPQPSAAPVAAPAAEPAAPPVAAPAPAPAAPAALRMPDDGTLARFSGTATDLPPGTAALLDLLARDKTVLWEIKGYSDRQANKPEPAREAALARALSVRKQLVLRGVPPQNLRVKYSTEEAREVVTVLPQGAAAAALPAATALQPLAPAAQALPPQKYAEAKSAKATKTAKAPTKALKDKKERKAPAASRAKAAPAKTGAHKAAAQKAAPHKAGAHPAGHAAHKKPAASAAVK